ncbi:MAG: hypothetical protein HKP20_03670 [Akkermansiaceae bacterium]|nr:hypothetical protein [Akkermansiaceae bacterium]
MADATNQLANIKKVILKGEEIEHACGAMTSEISGTTSSSLIFLNAGSDGIVGQSCRVQCKILDSLLGFSV